MAYCKQFDQLTNSKSSSCINCKNWQPSEQGGSCAVVELVLKK